MDTSFWRGFPEWRKTLLVRSLAGALHTSFGRIQFTPDLLPGDVVGAPVYHQATGEFVVHKGPVFTNLLLADEINRAPPKVQSALLEAMEEGNVTIDGTTYPLPHPFFVLATQNPIEQHGTYMLAEAQIDRFMMKLRMGYPDRDQEREIIERIALIPAESPDAPGADVSDHGTRGASQILEARAELDGVKVDRKIQEYVVDLVFATRYPADAGLPDFVPLLEFGGSPRASIFLTRAARANAYLAGSGLRSSRRREGCGAPRPPASPADDLRGGCSRNRPRRADRPTPGRGACALDLLGTRRGC